MKATELTGIPGPGRQRRLGKAVKLKGKKKEISPYPTMFMGDGGWPAMPKTKRLTHGKKSTRKRLGNRSF